MWSALVAEELGVISHAEVVERLGTTLTTIERLERHEPSGQYYNWYDHRTGEKLTVWPPTGAPLTPHLSSVDNGWLAVGLRTTASRVEELRARARVKQRARQRDETAKARGVDVKLARGHCLTRPYAVCTVTVPTTAPITEYGRRLDAAVRRAGYAPLRLDLAQDVAFAASTIPLGVSLTRRPTR